MRFLIDTHIFLWSLLEPEKLTPKSARTIQDIKNDIFVSAISFWEISLKYSLGKLELEGIHPDELPEIAERMSYEILDFMTEDAASFHRLPRFSHKDPFDRMIIWQAIRNNLVLITEDREIHKYKNIGLSVFDS